ncbi:PREDICTED: membrane protein FAM174A-like [Priapulus caudatus]|uniref:Membrane protein FAM174A-like n=1 Tax=Priapulus caudatus TaxID=37621 RepID=A0ABM1FA83_PRICU|nr:PREDICTED: membrane protein FAM174A-like [Priapulus caudatus]
MYKSGTLTRMIYVVMGITSIVVIYFVIRAVRVRTRKSKTKKYGILQTADTDLEMTPLDVGDEEEDMTVFELPSNRK